MVDGVESLRTLHHEFDPPARYAAGAVRMSAISELGVIYVATHDSIGLGEDGPTHQPVCCTPPHSLCGFHSIPKTGFLIDREPFHPCRLR